MNTNEQTREEAVMQIVAKHCQGTAFERGGLKEIIEDADSYFDKLYYLRTDTIETLWRMADVYMKANGYSEHCYKEVSRLVHTISCNIVTFMDASPLVDVIRGIAYDLENIK